MANDETITFYPKNSKEDEKPENGSQKSASSLSTRGRLISYNDQLKESLNSGLKFTELLDTLIQTKNTDELFDAAMSLVSYKLDTAYLVFPQQYSRADYYLIFLNRLLELHDNEHIVLNSSEHNHELYHEYPSVGMSGYFVFKLAEGNDHGAYYTEVNTGDVLFYLDFKQRVLRFNSHDLTDLLVVNYGSKFDYKTIRPIEETLLTIGRYLKQDYGFDVDFNILDPSNNALYPIVDDKVPQAALDKLFIKAADVHYMLKSGQHGDAILDLSGDIHLMLFDRSVFDQDKPSQWVISVRDKDNKVSWFDILFKFDFLRDWYLNNLNSLEIKSDSLYF